MGHAAYSSSRADAAWALRLTRKKKAAGSHPPREPTAIPSAEGGAAGYGMKTSGWKYDVASGTCRLFTWDTRTPASVMA
jgi:hypothetical protein